MRKIRRILIVLRFQRPLGKTFGLIPQRRGSLKNLSEGSHLFECSLSFILLISKFYPTTTQTFRCLIVVGVVWCGVVWCGWGRIYLFHFFFEKIEVFFLFFLNVFSYQGERFKFFSRAQQGNIRAQKTKIDRKIDKFWLKWFLIRCLLSIVFRYLYSLLPIADPLLWDPAEALLDVGWPSSAGFYFFYLYFIDYFL